MIYPVKLILMREKNYQEMMKTVSHTLITWRIKVPSIVYNFYKDSSPTEDFKLLVLKYSCLRDLMTI